MNNKVSESELKSIGYYILNKLEIWHQDLNCKIKDFDYTEYHNFWKCRFHKDRYQDILNLYNRTDNDVLVEIVRVKGDHTKDLHYHKISHAFCIILGKEVGLKSPDGFVQIEDTIIKAKENDDYYFPTNCKHTFHGGHNDLYFLSVQSPPLLSKDNDDFYIVN